MTLMLAERMTRLMQLLNQNPEGPVISDGVSDGTSPEANI